MKLRKHDPLRFLCTNGELQSLFVKFLGGFEIAAIEKALSLITEHLGNGAFDFKLARQGKCIVERFWGVVEPAGVPQGHAVTAQHLGHPKAPVIQTLGCTESLLFRLDGRAVASLVSKEHSNAIGLNRRAPLVSRVAVEVECPHIVSKRAIIL